MLNEVDCVQHYPTSTVTDLLINSEQVASKSGNSNRIITEGQKTEPRDSTGDLVDPKSLYYGALYEVTCPHFLIWANWLTLDMGSFFKYTCVYQKYYTFIDFPSIVQT